MLVFIYFFYFFVTVNNFTIIFFFVIGIPSSDSIFCLYFVYANSNLFLGYQKGPVDFDDYT